MNNDFYIRFWLTIIGLFFLAAALYFLKDLLIPILFAGLFSMLVLPLSRLLEKKLPRSLAVFICLLLIIGVITAMSFMFYTQIAILATDIPLFKAKAMDIVRQIQEEIQSQFHISAADQSRWLESNSARAASMAGNVAKSFLLSVTSSLADFLLVMIYFIFFLLLRERFKNFLLYVFHQESHDKVSMVLSKIQSLTRHYLVGLLKVVFILGTMNAVGFLALGIKQAIFLGYLRGLLNIIPYVGAVIGTIFPVFSAMVYQGPGTIVGVVMVSIVSQFIENNFLTPKIVGAHIKINPLATIIAILAGGMLWGLDGMILFLPLLGITKIVCDHIDELKPLGYLIGEENGEQKPGIFQKLFGKKGKERN